MTRLTIVLVRGAFADGSSWSGVVERGSQPTGLCDRRQRRPSAAACTIERHSVANLVDLDRQDLVLTRALATVRLQPTFLVEATSPAVLSAYPGREETVASGTGTLDCRLHQGSGHARPCNVLGHLAAPELGGSGRDVGVGARQHVRVTDDTTSPLRDEDHRAGGEFSETLGEVGGGLLHRQGV
jgi:hypothetical protein